MKERKPARPRTVQKTALPETDMWDTTENLVYDLFNREPYIKYVLWWQTKAGGRERRRGRGEREGEERREGGREGEERMRHARQTENAWTHSYSSRIYHRI